MAYTMTPVLEARIPGGNSEGHLSAEVTLELKCGHLVISTLSYLHTWAIVTPPSRLRCWQCEDHLDTSQARPRRRPRWRARLS